MHAFTGEFNALSTPKFSMAKFIDFPPTNTHKNFYQFSFFHDTFNPKPTPKTHADETQTNGADVKINGTDSESHALVSSQKYSQILGDHHTNNSAQNKTSSQHIYKSRGYNNKENFYNQRPGGRLAGSQRSWQRGGNYRTPVVNGKDRRGEENEKANDAKVDSTAEPIKFNEGES